ncbi:GNAT family N-acetyltransferase [Paenactinomyces guangxiensis]|uniref:GNAT family N-acetyltransferase n=1 Tax=Paenactinomyces guangxiensis TaxID=1490290 RepID=A0A7W1WNX1_9BACL|nr:GNAT family N-acetyltransferase [Paenactinomyces guangxiensis]MBA4493243.1 GNAT family N-acetyltransferase [Paenactinomyces guangxiensis]MBH8589907.1 GNAT family N-acetyltransferase [Paenactinomyces guangxiensis]
MEYRHYLPSDEIEIVRLWNRCLPRDPITPKRFRNLVLLDANFDPEGLRLAFDGEQLIGCVYAVRRCLPMHGTNLEPENGWIPFFFVAESYRNQGVGKQLFNEAFQFLHKAGRKQVFFASYAPNYILPGMDKEAYPDGYSFLQKLGFRVQYSPVAMDRSLVGFMIPEEVKALKDRRIKEGYTFEQVRDGDLYRLIRFATEVFNPDWGRAIREGILQGLPLERIRVAKHQNQIVGFCLYGGYEGVPERFGPFGVDPGQQGKGLGKILLTDALAAMRAEGLHGAWFLWTGEESPAGYLYKKTGFHFTRQFHVMRKRL